MWGSDWFEVDGTRLEARTWGPPPDRAPTLVLLHEGLGCVALWRDFPERLAAATGWGVLAYSRAGYGTSDPCDLPRPVDYMTDEAVRVLPQVLDQAGIRRSVLLGHSDGGSISALYGGHVRDHRIRGMILLAPHFFVEDVSVQAILAARDAYARGLRERLSRYHANVDTAFRGWNEAWLNPAFREWDITETLWPLQVPVLAIQGDQDPYGTRAQVDVIAQQMYAPAEVHLLDDCGHAPHQDHPHKVMNLVSDFLTRLERIEAAGPGTGAVGTILA